MLIYFLPQPVCCNFVSGRLPPGTALSWEEQEAVGQGSEQPPPGKEDFESFFESSRHHWPFL